MNKTVLNNVHKEAGARMVNYAGFEMPVEYSGINDEHNTVRNNVGIFDVSHMGEFRITGKNAFSFLQKVTTNDIALLQNGTSQYSCFTNENGGVIDDLLVYKHNEEEYMLIVNASNIEKNWNWLQKNNTDKASLKNLSMNKSILSVQGPYSLKTLQKITKNDLSQLSHNNFMNSKINGIENVFISATGYTGEKGFEISVDNKYTVEIWQAIMNSGKEFNIKPIGLAARDTLRLEMGYCLYGNELNDETTPLEAGLGWIVKFNNNNNFIGRPLLEKQNEEGISKRLVGFILKEKGIARQHYPINNQEGNKIGEVTSGTMSPFLKEPIGMGYIKKQYANIDQEIFISIRNKMIKAKIVNLPFVKK